MESSAWEWTAAEQQLLWTLAGLFCVKCETGVRPQRGKRWRREKEVKYRQANEDKVFMGTQLLSPSVGLFPEHALETLNVLFFLMEGSCFLLSYSQTARFIEIKKPLQKCFQIQGCFMLKIHISSLFFTWTFLFSLLFWTFSRHVVWNAKQKKRGSRNYCCK